MQSNCINCSAKTEGNYCSSCGQKISVKRLKWGTLLDELNQRVLGLDNKFFKTVKDLTLRPGTVAQSFIEGNRVKYIGPVGYFFILITIFVLLISVFDIDFMAYTSDTNELFSNQKSQSIETESFRKNIMSNMKMLSFGLIPFFVIGTYILFRRKRYNLLETSVFIFYSHAHPLFLSFAGLLIYKFTGILNNSYLFPISMLYFGYACVSFYEGNKVWNFFKGLFSYAFGLVIFALLIVIGIILLGIFNPELLHELFPKKN